jgi:hypothetical protein
MHADLQDGPERSGQFLFVVGIVEYAEAMEGAWART